MDIILMRKKAIIGLLVTICTCILLLPWNVNQWDKLSVSDQHPNDSKHANITFYVRTSSKPKLMYTFYCMLFRTAVFNWPASHGQFVLVLDDDNKADHAFGNLFKKQLSQHFPEWPLKVLYESQPKNNVLIFKKVQRNLGYNLQLWNLFYLDHFTNDSIIAYMDTDAQFRTPLTRDYLVKNGTKLWVIGIPPRLPGRDFNWMNMWISTTEKALGLKVMGCFMTTFPQLMWRDTVINARNYILRRFNTTDFGHALHQFWPEGVWLSSINIVMNYAWYFERDRYDWHMNIKTRVEINKGLPKEHQIQLEHVQPTIVGMAHLSYKRFTPHLVTPGYCETMRAIGKPVKGCQNITHDMDTFCEMIVIRPHMRPKWPEAMPSWCAEGEIKHCCRKATAEHYRTVAKIPNGVHVFNISKTRLVEHLAKEAGVKCKALVLP